MEQRPADVRSAGESVPLDWEAVRVHLAGHGLRLDRDPPPRQFAGGLANLNYLIHLDGKPAVLRRPPMGELPAGAYDMAREFRILSRLPDALPFVPRGLFLCDDPSVIGQRFQIIEYRPGLVIREHMPPELAGRPEVGARLSQVLLETLAAIHAVDTDTVGLDDLGRPDGFLARAVSGWRKRGLAAMEDGTEALHADVGAWLEQHLVPDGAPALLHNDFKLNNMILNPARPVAGRGGGLGPGHARRSAVRFRHPAELLDPPRRSAGDARHGADAGGRGRLLSARGGGGGVCRADRPRHVQLPVPSRAGDVQAGRDLPAAWPSLPHRRDHEPRYAGLTAIGTGILEFTHEIAQGRAF